VVAATILSGFFALSSFSLRTFSRARLEDLLTGARGRKRLDSLDRNLKALRLMLSLCRTLANLVLVAGMVRLLGEEVGDWTHLLAAIGWAAALIAVFGVAIPHAWAAYGGETFIRYALPLLLSLRYALYPLVAVMQAFDLPVRRLSGSEDSGELNGDSAKQEIIQAASEGHAEGAVDQEEMDMIESVMEFGDSRSGEIMTPRTDIFALPEETPWMEAARQIHRAGHTRVPIFRENLDNITGIIYAKDLLRYVGHAASVTLTELARKPFFVPETKPLDDLLREFKARKVHIAVVLDEYGGTAGLVTIEDVLEEIVGEIADEYDIIAEAQVLRINENTVEVDGRLYVDELNDVLELDLPEDEDYDTIAGYVFAELGYIPTVGESFAADGAEFTIMEADERKIIKLRVKKLITETAEE
jgi:CBS domain containing-hemolysin-like protein